MLTVADLRERSRNHAHESQILLSGVMKSVTVGNAAYTLVMLAGSSVTPLLWLPYRLARPRLRLRPRRLHRVDAKSIFVR